MGNKHFEKCGEPNELKTLEDINLIVKQCPKSEEDNLIQYMELERKRRLKDEAIKWVKYASIDRFEEINNKDLIDWIKHFFNIEEKDLK